MAGTAGVAARYLGLAMNLDLTGRRALVCGSTQGIGRACAEALAEQGASVTLMARDTGALERVRSALPRPRGKSQEHSALVADFTNPSTVERAIESDLAANHEGYQILVNNTGGPAAGRAVDAQPDQYAGAFASHLLCNQVLVRALVPGMEGAGYGRIINIISTSVKAPIMGLGVSNTIRAAVAQWGKTLSMELGPLGITVNNVLPGFTDTARLRSLLEHKAKEGGRPLEAVIQESKKAIPIGRFAEAREIAWAVAFLASPAAAYISGINLPVDGGRTPGL